ncbi:hypothetical protein H4R24_000379 [Coemansia sp. RSA 988]|nr:hypothetical protein H4R24_000379 [Coemansia sp. RSA 988]
MAVGEVLARHARQTAALVQSRGFRQELGRTLTAWGVLFVVGVWMVVCQQWSDMRWIRRIEEDRQEAAKDGLGPATDVAVPWPHYAMLDDQLLEHLPLLERAWISDKLVGSSVIVCIIGCSVLARGWRQRLMLIRRIAWMVAVLYFLRSVTISVTTVPPSIDSCVIAKPQSTWQVIKATPDILAGTIGQCTDKIFSGHTAILTISFLFWRRYATHWAFVAYSVVHVSLGIVTVLMARYHYTVDVVIGFLLTYFVHHMYYAALEQAAGYEAGTWLRQPAYADHGGEYLQMRQQDHPLDHPHQMTIADSDEHATAIANSNVYSMSVFAPPLPKGAPEGIDDDSVGWRDRDSALGVDVASDRHTPTAFRDVDNDASLSVVRKRETSAATTTDTSERGDSAQGSRYPSSATRVAAPATASPTSIHHEITVAEPLSLSPTPHLGLPIHASRAALHKLSDDCADYPFSHAVRSPLFCADVASPHYQWQLEMLGINRPFGAVLPRIVAWMDGLDIRIGCP